MESKLLTELTNQSNVLSGQILNDLVLKGTFHKSLYSIYEEESTCPFLLRYKPITIIDEKEETKS